MIDNREQIVLISLDLDSLKSMLTKLDFSKVELLAIISDSNESIDVRINEHKIPFYDFSALDKALQETSNSNTYYLLCGYTTQLRVFGFIRRMLKILGNISNDKIVNASMLYEPSFIPAYQYAMQGNLDFFATGISYMMAGLSLADLPLGRGVNLASSSQDIYYGLEIAKRVLPVNPQAKYAFVGLSPYAFSYCLKESFSTLSTSIVYELLWNFEHNSPLNKFFKSTLLTNQFEETTAYNPEYNLRDSILNLRNMLDIDRALHDILPSGNPEHIRKNKEYLKEYIDLCQSYNCTPIGVIFPVSPLLQKNYPSYALTEYLTILNDFSLLYNFKYVNLWDMSLPLNCFYDLPHLNRQGAKQVTQRLYAEINKLGLLVK